MQELVLLIKALHIGMKIRLKKKIEDNEISKIIYKSDDVTSMSMKEYELYIKNYTEKSNYPKLNNE